MAVRTAREFREMTAAELKNQVLRAKEDLMKMRFQHTIGQLTDTSAMQKKKIEISRILTVLREKEE